MCSASEDYTPLEGYDPETDTYFDDVDCRSENTEEFEMFCQEEKKALWEKKEALGDEEPIWDTFGFSYVFLKEDRQSQVGHLYIKHKGKRQKPKLEQG